MAFISVSARPSPAWKVRWPSRRSYADSLSSGSPYRSTSCTGSTAMDLCSEASPSCRSSPARQPWASELGLCPMDHEAGRQVTVRRATAADAAALAGLSWHHLVEEHGYAGTDRDAYVDRFANWLTEHRSTHVPFLAEVDDRVVGMATLMVAARVPT